MENNYYGGYSFRTGVIQTSLPPVKQLTSSPPLPSPPATSRTLSAQTVLVTPESSQDVNKPLFVALHNGFTGQVKLALESGANSNGADEHGNRPLHIIAVHFAEFEHSLELAHILLKAGADVNVPDASGRVALSTLMMEYSKYFYCRKGYLQLVQLFVDHNVDVNRADNNGWTPIHWCSYYGDQELFELLRHTPLCDLNKQTSCAAKGLCALSTPLHIAVQKNPLLAISIAESDADTSLYNADGWLPLHIAMDILEDKNMELIYKLTIPADVVNKPIQAAKKSSNLKSGYYPLHIAVFKQKAELIQLLLEQGAAINVKHRDGQQERSAFDLALLVESLSGLNNYPGLWMLVSAGSRVTTNDEDPHYLLDSLLTFEKHIVVNYADTPLFTSLLEAGYTFHTSMLFMGGSLERDDVLEELLKQQVYPRSLQLMAASVVRQNLLPNAWVGVGNLNIKPELKELITLGYYSEIK